MSFQSVPRSAEEYARAQRAESAAAVSAVRRQWRRMGTEFDASYVGLEPTLLDITDAAQGRVASAAADFVPAVLSDLGLSRAVEPRFEARTSSLVGVTGDGRTTEGLLYGAVTHAKQLVGAGFTAPQALASSGNWLSTSVSTLLADTRRSSEKLQTMARPVTGYVRMLSLPSCGRCAILAGKFYRVNRGFQRHPRCDCTHIPSTESLAGDMTVNARAYFDSLDAQGQARLVGSRANAEAVRDGADINQVVNAYRRNGGVSTAQVYGRDVKYTTEGTTKRGSAFRAMRGTRAAGGPRLMPETIASIATDAADRQRLLKLYGWIL